MNEVEWLKQMADRAGQDAPPRIDVTAAVLRELRSSPRQEQGPLAVFAAVSAVAAAIVFTVAVQAWQDLGDPLAAMMSSINVVMK